MVHTETADMDSKAVHTEAADMDSKAVHTEATGMDSKAVHMETADNKMFPKRRNQMLCLYYLSVPVQL